VTAAAAAAGAQTQKAGRRLFTADKAVIIRT
jgi:hypothetical protein